MPTRCCWPRTAPRGRSRAARRARRVRVGPQRGRGPPSPRAEHAARAERDVADRGEVREQVEPWNTIPTSRRRSLTSRSGETSLLAVQQDRPLLRLRKSVDTAQHGRLPGARGTDQDSHIAPVHLEGNIAEHLLFAVPLRDVRHAKEVVITHADSPPELRSRAEAVKRAVRREREDEVDCTDEQDDFEHCGRLLREQVVSPSQQLREPDCEYDARIFQARS